MNDEPVNDAPDPLSSASAPERWKWMFQVLRRGPRQDRRFAQGGFDDTPIDLDRRQTAAYKRQAAERALLLNLAIDTLIAKHRRRPPR